MSSESIVFDQGFCTECLLSLLQLCDKYQKTQRLLCSHFLFSCQDGVWTPSKKKGFTQKIISDVNANVTHCSTHRFLFTRSSPDYIECCPHLYKLQTKWRIYVQ